MAQTLGAARSLPGRFIRAPGETTNEGDLKRAGIEGDLVVVAESLKSLQPLRESSALA